MLYSLLPTLEPFYGPADSQARAKAVSLFARLDRDLARGRGCEDAVALALLLWPAIREMANEQDMAQGRQGRAQWALFVREHMPELAQPVSFAKRVVEQTCQIAGLMGFVLEPHAAQRPAQAGHGKRAISRWPAAWPSCWAATCGPWPNPSRPVPPRKKRRRRRRRRPRRKPPAHGKLSHP